MEYSTQQFDDHVTSEEYTAATSLPILKPIPLIRMSDSAPPTSTMDDEAVQAPSKKPTASQKKVWLLTYCPAGTYITPAILKDHGLIADECHSTADRVMNYTYIHLTQKVRQTRIEKFMKSIQTSHGMIQNEIFGYDSIASTSLGFKKDAAPPIQQHIVFQMLLKHCKENAPSFLPNTDGEPVLKRGYLFNEVDIGAQLTRGGPEHQSKKQLIKHIKSLENKLEEYKNQESEMQSLVSTYLEVSEERSSLRIENTALKRKISQLETSAASNALD